ncbi:hypothetical protein O181_097282 [Austropuccinia psidii MF-1]|uniref:Uncharacterized protein n=1 Tax=Austropuccinia psidii MF-1 TaxID=1389203 RepID=A0A9Q3J8Y7_9BASI|nr:hypothetical protein [Austropuccinia psidii MF-1]
MTQLPGELEHAVKCSFNQICTLDDTSNTSKEVSKRKNIGKNYLYKGNSFREKQTFRADNKTKPREIVEEVLKKNNSCHNCGSRDHYAISFPKENKKIDAIEQGPEEEIQPEDFEYESMGDAIREYYDYDQAPIEVFLVEYQEETQLEIQDIQLEGGLPQETANKSLKKHTQDAHTFLVSPTEEME